MTSLTACVGFFLFLFNWFGFQAPQAILPDSGKPALLYSNQSQDDLRTTFVSAINDATTSIDLFIYSLTDQQIINALKEKADQGVKVTVIHDPDTSQWGFEKLGNKITCFEKSGAGLMHRKILVVDYEKIWIGSANFTTDSLRLHDNLVIGLVSRELAKRIAQSNCYQTPNVLAQPPPLFQVGGQRMEFWLLPEEKELAFKRLIQLIDESKHDIKIAMFTWTHPEITAAVIRAHKRGVKIDAAIDHQSGLGCSSQTVEKLSEAHIEVGLSSGTGLLHHKFALIDGKILVNGSANWTKAAFSKNEDCFVVLHDLNQNQIDKMNKIWKVIRCQRDLL